MREAAFTASRPQACSAPAALRVRGPQSTYCSAAFRRNLGVPACITAPRIPEPAKARTTEHPWVRGSDDAAMRWTPQRTPTTPHLRAAQQTYCSPAFRRNLGAPACVIAPRIPAPDDTPNAPRGRLTPHSNIFHHIYLLSKP